MTIEEHYFDCPVIKQTVKVMVMFEKKHMGLPPSRVFRSCSGILVCGSENNEPYTGFSSPDACPLHEHLGLCIKTSVSPS